jgi:CRP/FNR family cyclic AMP-dependent transcriptional regulator
MPPHRGRRKHRQYLLDLDPELASGLDVRMRLVARPALTAVTFAVEPGELDLARWLTAAERGPGLLILSGALVGFTRVCDRVAAEVLDRGDVIESPSDEDEFVRGEVAWRALQPARLAVLDAGFAERAGPWPQVTDELLHRAQRRAHDLAAARAIAAQPRLDLRLVLTLWQLAPRWGKVEPGGIRVSLPLTHQLLGRLVGAERPSVTHALKRLAAAGLVAVQHDGVHLHGTLERHLDVLGERGEERVERLRSTHAGHGMA